MALVLKDRVQVSATANTTVSFTCGAATTGFQAFSVIGNANTTYYTATDGPGNWESGIGTYTTAGTLLTRTTVLASSNAGSAVTFSGAVNLFVNYPATKSINYDAAGVATIGGTLGYSDTGLVSSFASTVAGYNQVVVQNKSTATNASSNLNVSNDAGTASANYAELGINSSTFSNGAGCFNIPGAAYVASAGEDLSIGTYGPHQIHFATNSNTTDSMTIYDGGGISLGTYGNPGIGNVAGNKFVAGFTSITSATGTTVLTAASTYYQRLVGTAIQTIQLPDATTCLVGTTFIFDNDSTGALTVTDGATGAIDVIPAGGVDYLYLISNTTVAGTWARYALLPSNYNFNATSADFGAATLSNGVWNGTPIAYNYGGTTLTTFVAANNALYSTSATALTAGTLPVLAGGTGVTTSTGTGSTVLSASPTLSNPTYTGTLTGGTGILNIGSGQVYKDASGNVGVGTSSPASKLSSNVSGVGSITALNLTNDNLGWAAGTGTAINFGFGGTNVGMFGKIEVLNQTATIGSNSYMAFSTRVGDLLTERLRINSAGGVSFGATGTAYGTSGQVLSSAGNASPTWTTPTTGTVTSVATSGNVSGITLTGGTITGSGTITLGGAIGTLNQNTTGSSASCTGNAASATYATTATNYAGGNGYTVGNTAAFASANDTTLSVRGTSTTAATMSFHRPGSYAANFGIDTDNILKYGGWSAGSVYPVYHGGNPQPSVTGSSASCTGNAASATYAGIRSMGEILAGGSAVTFTNIPAGVKRITVVSLSVGVTSTIVPLIRLGTSVGIVSTGYSGSTWYHSTTGISGAAITLGFDMLNSIVAANTYHGSFILNKIPSGNIWTCVGGVGRDSGGVGGGVHGSVTLTGEITQLSIQLPTTAFDAGSFSIYYE